MNLRMKKLYKRIEAFVERYDRQISSVALVTGFIVDSLTLRRIDLLAENLIFMAYIAAVAAGIATMNLYMGGKLKSRAFEYAVPVIPAVIQYAIGGLMSGFVVFYSRSSALSASWPFLLLLVFLLIGNESFKKHYARFSFQVCILFFALLSFSIFSMPILLGSMGPAVFLLSGAVSLVAVALFLFALHVRVPKLVRKSLKSTVISITGIFVAVMALYFGNAIPPIPLSLMDSGVYHKVVPSDGGYILYRESGSNCGFLCFRETIHIFPGEPVYAYSAVFAPTRLGTVIAHRWQRYDEASGRWQTQSVVSFPIRGGRDNGYRGYSMKSNVLPGKWRVDVITGGEQVIGRINFAVERAVAPPAIETVSGL